MHITVWCGKFYFADSHCGKGIVPLLQIFPFMRVVDLLLRPGKNRF